MRNRLESFQGVIMRRLATALSAMACIGAVAASAYLLTMPAYEGLVTSTSSAVRGDSGSVAIGGDVVRFTRTLAEENGLRIWVILLVVTLIATLPLAVALIRPTAQRTTTWIAALLLSAFSVLAGFSIGLFFMPSALILLAAAVATLFVRDLPAREPGRSREAVRAGSPR
jgi:hypothetical protein